MTNFIIIDTNILISLGLNFKENIDFGGIKDYCYSSGSELVITNTIKKEYLNFYKTKILNKSIDNLNQVYDKLKRLKHFKNIAKPNLQNQSNHQLAEVEHNLNEYHIRSLEEFHVDKDELVNFLINNKQENKKDNTRDYLIWRDALSIAEKIDENQVILISNDKIFPSNKFFERMRLERSISNIKHYNSIASFLSIYGFRSKNLNEKLVLKSIPEVKIKEELLEHKDAILSYISKFYWHPNFKLELESLKIKGLDVKSLYAHKDQKTNFINVTTHLQVKALMVFKPDPRLEELKIYLTELTTINSQNDYYANTFDKEGRPIFDDNLLFIISFIYDEKLNELTNIKIHDFVPPPPNYRR